MRTAWMILCWSTFAACAGAADFTRATAFESVASFVSAAEGFQPTTVSSDLSALFGMPELGEPTDPRTGKTILATKMEAAKTIWAGNSQALVFVTALPGTEATRSSIGVLFLLVRKDRTWKIADLLRAKASGKSAGVTAELTAGVGRGYQLGDAGIPPVITLGESHGGRGYSYQISASYSVEGSKFKRLALE